MLTCLLMQSEIGPHSFYGRKPKGIIKEEKYNRWFQAGTVEST